MPLHPIMEQALAPFTKDLPPLTASPAALAAVVAPTLDPRIYDLLDDLRLRAVGLDAARCRATEILRDMTGDTDFNCGIGCEFCDEEQEQRDAEDAECARRMYR